MSWNREWVGTKKRLLAEMEKEKALHDGGAIPDHIKQACIAALVALPGDKPPVKFSTTGHIGTNEGFFKIEVSGVGGLFLADDQGA